MVGDGCMWLRICAVDFESRQMCEEHGAGMCVCGLHFRTGRSAGRWMESPLEKMNVCGGTLASFEPIGGLFYIPAAIIGCRPRQRKDKLRMGPGCAVDAMIRLERDDGAEG